METLVIHHGLRFPVDRDLRNVVDQAVKVGLAFHLCKSAFVPGKDAVRHVAEVIPVRSKLDVSRIHDEPVDDDQGGLVRLARAVHALSEHGSEPRLDEFGEEVFLLQPRECLGDDRARLCQPLPDLEDIICHGESWVPFPVVAVVLQAVAARKSDDRTESKPLSPQHAQHERAEQAERQSRSHAAPPLCHHHKQTSKLFAGGHSLYPGMRHLQLLHGWVSAAVLVPHLPLRGLRAKCHLPRDQLKRGRADGFEYVGVIPRLLGLDMHGQRVHPPCSDGAQTVISDVHVSPACRTGSGEGD
mmetsp:Transcript_66450/g.149992  ORF Transcript_66450/g.149992 Transcript_66450/m.149992 type:complete len:300 (+) Transcript_66450:409-1308(+)